ncbi:MAG TPA: DUF4388 domain-containing protein [Acidimicrobiales bacterium]|nr:DUF4388 domain-containing protein [Acidimicrobiales bacterium]
MSLEGTLETIALPDVLALLSVTAKTGELRIESRGGVGSVWFDAGRLAGFDVGTHTTAVDSLFGLLRVDEGHFKFYTGTSPVHAVEPQDVAPVMEEAESRLVQWAGIAAAVPSMYSQLSLQGSAEGPVTLSADQWQLVATIGGGKSVADVLKTQGFGEFDGCKAVKELVDLHLVHVDSSDVPPAPQLLTPAAERSTEPLSELSSEHNFEYSDHSADYSNNNSDHTSVNGSDNGSDQLPEFSGASAETVELAGAGQETPQVDEVADLSEVWSEDDVEVPLEEEPVEVAAAPKPEPVNRGLLLKFLGSARN